MELVSADAIIGLYHAAASEAPASGYAKFFSEAGHTIALPTLTADNAQMVFAEHTDPFGETDLVDGPFGVQQPDTSAAVLVPDVVFTPLLGFTEDGERLGQGGGHFDRWLAKHTDALAIGLAWDGQLVASLPTEPHDMPLSAVVTPTRLYGPF